MESGILDRDTLPRIDLSAERRAERRGVLVRSRRDALLLGVLLCGTPLLLGPLTQQVLGLRAQLGRAEREAAAQEKQLQSVVQASAETEAQMSRWSRFVQSRGRRETWRDILPALAARTPEAVYLEQVQIDEKSKSVRILLQGAAESVTALGAFTGALGRTPLFSEVSLTETAAERKMGPRGIRFQVGVRVLGALADGSGAETR